MPRQKGDPTRIVCIEDRGGEGEKRFRVKLLRDGKPGSECFPDERAALAFARGFRREEGKQGGPTGDMVIGEFVQHMEAERHWRPGSWTGRTGNLRLRRFLDPMIDMPVAAVTSADLLAKDKQLLAQGKAIKSLNEYVIIVTQLFRFAQEEKRYRRDNPAMVLKRRRGANAGKPGLTLDEAVRFRAVVEPSAQAGDESAIIALAALLIGARSSELLSRKPRDVDGGGTVLRSIDTKKNKPMMIRIPTPLQAPLSELAALKTKAGAEWLFTSRYRTWPNRRVQKWCADAGVPVVSCQGMRGTHDSIAVEIGEMPETVARATGHTLGVMKRSYLRAGALNDGRASRVEERLEEFKSANRPEAVSNGNESHGKLSQSTAEIVTGENASGIQDPM